MKISGVAIGDSESEPNAAEANRTDINVVINKAECTNQTPHWMK